MISFSLISNPNFIIKQLQFISLMRSVHFLRGIVLDIGCGRKPYKMYITCDTYIGSDDESGVKPDVCSRASAISFKEASCDAVLCTEVLEHLDEPSICLKEIKRVLKDGGYLYLTVPQSWGLHYEPRDYWRFTKYGIEHILKKEGYKIISLNRVGGIFSMISQELIDALWTSIKALMLFTGERWAERFATAILLPLSVFGYFFSTFADKIDKRYALGWAVVARK